MGKSRPQQGGGAPPPGVTSSSGASVIFGRGDDAGVDGSALQARTHPPLPELMPHGPPDNKEDPYILDDFYPLRSALELVLSALRSDESSTDADPYRKIASFPGSEIYRIRRPSQDTGANGKSGSVAEASPGFGASSTISGLSPGTPLTPAQPWDRSSTPAESAATTPQASPHPLHVGKNSSRGSMAPIRPRMTIPLPSFLSQEINSAKFSSTMGLLSEANLAWITVDHKLYVWSYDLSVVIAEDRDVLSSPLFPGNGKNLEHGKTETSKGDSAVEDFCCFTVPSGQSIVSVGLVRPRKGVFKEVVEWCLVVTTPEEAILCALARESTNPTAGENMLKEDMGGFSRTPDSVFRLIPTRFVISNDSTPLLCVTGTSDGRIFLGGSNGSLYEMAYEGFFTSGGSALPFRSIDEDNGFDEYTRNGGSEPPSLAGSVLAGSKRLISEAVFGSSSLDTQSRPRKCRKLDHTSFTPPVVSAVVPKFLLNVASAAVGGLVGITSNMGGSIVSLLPDHNRSKLYALTSKGFIHAFNIDNSAKITMPTAPLPPPKLSCTVDIVESAKRYLEAVARGRMYPPATPAGSSNPTIAAIEFPGGDSAAQNGVGGANGARAILRAADAADELNSGMFRRRRRQDSAAFNSTSDRRRALGGILLPVSIHVVPPSESKTLTLVAITGGGIRCYLSTSELGKRFTLSHIRSPPPFSIGSDGHVDFFDPSSPNVMSSLMPDVSVSATTSSSDVFVSPGTILHNIPMANYNFGSTILAVDTVEGRGGQSRDAIISISPDNLTRIISSDESTTDSDLIQSGGLGLGEIASLPLAGNSISKPVSSILPGGRVWDISCTTANSSSNDSFESLCVNSTTPTDAELRLGLPPPFYPASRIRRHHASSKENSSVPTLPPSTLSTALTALARAAIGLPVQRKMLLPPPPTSHPSTSTRGGFNGNGEVPAYRLSGRYGCNQGGFSSSAGGKFSVSSGRSVSLVRTRRPSTRQGRSGGNAGSIVRSPRLSPWLLSPSPTPLSDLAMPYRVLSQTRRDIIILNSGGLHLFICPSALDDLKVILSSTKSVNAPTWRDGAMRLFFEDYGYTEGCAMCLSIAISASFENDAIRSRALQAALRHGRVPTMYSSTHDSEGDSLMDSFSMGGLEFRPSALHNGLLSLLSRLLRPVWHKPAVVVTEGITSSRGRNFPLVAHPAKVELLLDEQTSERIRSLLSSLQKLMKELFKPAVLAVPGAKSKQPGHGGSDPMDVDDTSQHAEADRHLITWAMQYQAGRTAKTKNTTNERNRKSTLSEKGLEKMARLAEERNLHSIYRLLARTIQLISLISLLRRAQESSNLPEVEWGLLHGLTYAQLVTTRSGQDRVEAILTNLVSSGMWNEGGGNHPSASSLEGDNLLHLLSTHCYLYFSPGSRLTHLGVQTAVSALSCPPESPRRVSLSNRAMKYFLSASLHWSNPSLVTGRLLHSGAQTSGDETRLIASNVTKWYDDAAKRALDYGSPLARVATILMDLGDVGGLIDICLICASNFGGVRPVLVDRGIDSGSNGIELKEGMMSWEHGLYHRSRPDPQVGEDMDAEFGVLSTSTTAGAKTGELVVSGVEVTKEDALRTCHAVIFHHVSDAFKSSSRTADGTPLAEHMVAVASASTDKKFLYSFFSYLIDIGHVETLLRIDSLELEQWLRDIHKTATLLWKFYMIHGIDWMAGEVMWKRACSTSDENFGLDQRIECLTRAQTSYCAALGKSKGQDDRRQFQILTVSKPGSIRGHKAPPSVDLNRSLTQVNEQLEIAIIQRRTLSAIQASANALEVESSKLEVLSISLVTVSELYNDYAAPLALYDICLLILQTCHHNDAVTITALWKSIFCEEILPCHTNFKHVQDFLQKLRQGSMLEEAVIELGDRGGNADVALFEEGRWVPRLRHRVVSLGKDLFGKGADYTFPLEILLEYFEGLRLALENTGLVGFSDGMDASWAIQCIIDVGVSYLDLFEAYDAFLETQERETMGPMDMSERLRRLSSISCLLSEWVKAAFFGTTGARTANGFDSILSKGNNAAHLQLSRAVSVGNLSARIDSYKARLESLVGANASEVAKINSSLIDVERTIRRSL